MTQRRSEKLTEKKANSSVKAGKSVMFQYWTYTHSLDIIQSGIVFIKIAEMYGKSIHVHRSDLRSVGPID